MKKLIILFAVALFAFSAQAQKVYTFGGEDSDTLTASVTKTYEIPIGTDGYKDFSVQLFTEEVSGTPAYTAKIEYTVDGTNYVEILSAPNDVHTGGGDNAATWQSRYYKTFSVTGDTTTVMVHSPVLGSKIKVTVTATAATQKSNVSGSYIIAKLK